MRCIDARLTLALLASTALSGGGAFAQSLPTGGRAVSGSVAISPASGNTLNIRQSSQGAIVNWQGFSIGQGNTVNIRQPNSASALLNRVTGSTPSTIAGRLNANGQVYLVNPNGIAITKTGIVKASGFVASTLGVSDGDFLAGKAKLKFKGGGASKAVTNDGLISVGRGGYAALIGGTVSNSGRIIAPMGKVGLGSGETATLDFSGTGFLKVAAPTNFSGKAALVSSAGTIKADGGLVVIEAATAREVARNAVNIGGLVQARSIGGRSGAIDIGGGPGGSVNVSGRLDASGVSGKDGLAKDGSVKGGRVTVTGRDIALKGAEVDVSGRAGGGQVRIGGGTVNLPRAASVKIDATTSIKADATGNGKGGSVVVWSDGATSVKGRITARGAGSGGGGAIETSGKTVDFSGLEVNTSAPRAAAGTWLIDPVNLTVGAAAAKTISDNLAASNVILQTTASGASGPGVQAPGAGDITIASAISWSSSQSLTLDAYHALAIDAPVTVKGAGKLSLKAAADPAIPTLALLSFGQGASVRFMGTPNTGQALNINSKTYTLLYSMSDVLAVNSNLAGNYALAKPLDAAGTTYTKAVIAAGGTKFNGAFEGLGNTISNLTIKASTADDIGLFGDVGAAGTIAHLGLIGGSISGANNVGALAGKSDGAIAQSYETGKVAGASPSFNVGGLVGYNTGSITRSFATGGVSSISGSGSVGGLVGSNIGTITQSYATGTATGASGEAGGLAGYNNGTIKQSYATGAVSNSQISGGLVGLNSGSITQSYAMGRAYIRGSGFVGGLVGSNSGTINETYATGAITFGPGDILAGGLVGRTTGSVTNSYWDIETTGQSTSAGGTGLVTGEFLDKKNFVGWTFGTTPGGDGWVIVDQGGTLNNAGGQAGASRPFLLSEYSTNIVNAHQLQLMALSTSANYTLGADIDLGPALTNPAEHWFTPANTLLPISGFNPIGQAGNQYSGIFDGQGHTISNLTIQRPTNAKEAAIWTGTDVGLFGYVNTAGVIENVKLVGGSVTGYNTVGALAGKNHGLVQNSSSSARVNGNDYIGGLVGWSYGTITQSSASGAVTGHNYVGGLTGGNNVNLSLSSATGPVSGYFAVGGLVGENSGFIWDSHASGKVTGAAGGDTGGLAGLNQGIGTIKTSYATGAVSGGAGAYVGGLVGYYYAGGSISGSYATGAVSGSGDYMGGLVGFAGDSISGSYATGAVTGGSYVGGLAGWNYGAITKGNASGAVSGYLYVGGLTGGASNAITNSVATGTVKGNSYVGGLAGYIGAGGSVAQSDAKGAVIATGNYAGGLAGEIASGGSVSSATATGTVSGDGYIGGLAGWAYGAITKSNASGKVTGNQYVGGLTGGDSDAITDSFATGAVGGNSYVGGLSGYIGSGGSVSHSYATGAVSATANYAGGLIGVNASGGSITSDHATGTVSGDGYIGGLVGWNYGAVSQSNASGNVSGNQYVGGLAGGDSNVITFSFATGRVRGNSYVGGLSGSVDSRGSISQAYATGAVTATANYAGGLVGKNLNGSISSTYATGKVTGHGYVGGLVGYNGAGGALSQSYATGAVSGDIGFTGGLLGENNGGTVSNSTYWDTTTTGQSQGVGTSIAGSFAATGRTTAQLQAALPAGFDPAIWSIIPNVTYPFLKNVPPQP